MAARWWPWLRRTARDVRGVLRGHDLMLAAAGVTFYAGVALVPLLLVSVAAATLLAGAPTVRELGGAVGSLVPEHLGAQRATGWLVDAGSALRWNALLASTVAATFYGEGLRRAFTRVTGETGEKPATWRARLSTLVFLALGGPAVLLVGALAGALHHALGTGLGARLWGVYLSFVVGWAACSAVCALGFRLYLRREVGWRARLTGAVVTGSVLSGMLLGLDGVLRLPVDPGRAYGGLGAFGVVILVGGWLWCGHLAVLVGSALVYVLDHRRSERAGAPSAPIGQDPERPRLGVADPVAH